MICPLILRVEAINEDYSKDENFSKDCKKKVFIMYRVYQDDKPADSKHFPRLRYNCWSNSLFENKREAEVYACLWAYPVSREEAEVNAPYMENGVKYDFGMTEFPVYMSVRWEENG